LYIAVTGTGIAPDAIERIFNEFTQANYKTARRFGGTGLGLTITRSLLELYGSTLQVRSAPAEGSTFSFMLRLMLPAS
jgi:signal transduction histidine kinase